MEEELDTIQNSIPWADGKVYKLPFMGISSRQWHDMGLS